MQPQPSRDADFWNRLAPGYAKKPVPDEAAYRLTLDRVRTHLSPGDRVLEFGCGTGSTALHLAPSVREFHATDVSDAMIGIAQQKAQVAGITNAHFATGTPDAPEFADASFDTVMAFNLLHLLGDIPGSLRRAHSLLRPGGLFISKTPCIGDASFLLRGVIPALRVFGKAPFVNFVTKDSLKADVALAGFEIVETGLYPAKSHSLFIVARKRTS